MHGRGKPSVPGMRSKAFIVQEVVREPLTGITESSDTDTFVQPEFVWLSQEAAVSMQMSITDSEQLSRRLENKSEKSLLSTRV